MIDIYLTDITDNAAIYYLTNDGDIVDTLADADLTGYATHRIHTHPLYCGSYNEWKNAIRNNLVAMGIIQ